MKLAFSQPTPNEQQEKVLFSGFLSAGYSGLQLKGGQYLPWINQPEHFRELADNDASLVSGLIFGSRLDDEGVAQLRKIISFASSISSERVIFCHGVPRSEVSDEDIRDYAGILSRLANEASDQGVALSLHHHYNQPVMYLADLRTFYGSAESSTLKLTIDTAHMWMSGQDDVGAAILEFQERLDNVHLKDCSAGNGDERGIKGERLHTQFASLGKGDMAFESIFAALRQISYSSWLCVDEESGADVQESMELSYEFIQRHLADSAK